MASKSKNQMAMLSQLGKWVGGGTPSTDNEAYWNGNIPWVSPKDMRNAYITSTQDYITDAALSDSSTALVPKDSILVVTRSGILRSKVPVALTSIPMAINQDIKALIPDGTAYTPYIAQALWGNQKKLLMQCVKSGTTVESIDLQQLKDFKIYLPPLPEQRKIAAILRTWDDAIEKTESLIQANKKRLFLLTTSLIFGHIRLGKRPIKARIDHKWGNGPKDWKLQQIGDIAVERSELNAGGATHTVLSCSKHDGFVRSLDYFKKQIFSKNLAGYKTIYRGDFGFPSNHVEEGSIGLQNLEDKALVSPIYIVFTPDEKCIHADFLFRLLKTKTYAHIFRASTSSSVDRRGNLRWAEFSSIPVCLPDLKEQQEISEFLTGQQNLIDDLYRYKQTLQSQKRGLMQKLLTGEWRVQVDDHFPDVSKMVSPKRKQS